MKKFAVIGNPIDHSMSPKLHNWIFNKLKINAKYDKVKLKSNELNSFLNEIRLGLYDGINITIPYKETVIEYLDDINIRAELIGSVNFIMNSNGKLIGNNTDWFGFTRALKSNSIDLQGKEVIVIGSGGTSRSILFSLKQLGVKNILIFNRTLDNAKLLEDTIARAYLLEEIVNFINNESVIINTTPIGMLSNESLISIDQINKSQIIIDIIYSPIESSLIKMGKNIGAKTLNGLDMFIYQGLASLDLWFGKDIENQVNFKQIKSYLERHLC